jgi:hypothetical protein
MAKTEIKQLPKEIIPTATKREISGVILGTVICAIVFNILAIFYLAVYSPNTGYLLIAEKWKIMQGLDNPVDLLILGDSSGNQGVDPDVVKNRTGMSAVNLCTIGGTIALNDAYILDAYIEQHGAPKAVVVVHGYDVWSRTIEDNIGSLAKIPGDWWNREPDLDIGLKDKVRIHLDRFVPLYSGTISLGMVMQYPFIAFKRGLHSLKANGMVHEMRADPDEVDDDMTFHLDYIRYLGDADAVAEPNRRALAYIGELALRHDFDVFVANGPVYDRFAADEEYLEFYRRLHDELKTIIESNPRLHFILNPPAVYTASQLQSVDHIVGPAVTDFTTRITNEITAILDSTVDD